MRRLRSDNSNLLTVQLALPPPTLKQGYNVPFRTIHWLNDDILLDIFNCYRLDEANGWNNQLGWRHLSQVCQRWRHLLYECSSHLGMHIECSNRCPIALDTLDHLSALPLFLSYHDGAYTSNLLGQRRYEDIFSNICHALRLHGRLFHLDLMLYPSRMDEVVTLMDEHFPILKHLSLSFPYPNNPAWALPNIPNGFLAPNLRHLSLPNISPPKRLRFLMSTVSLVTLKLRDIQTSSYVRPRLLVARLRSLPLLEELSIGFSMPIPHPSAERELLGEPAAPVTFPSLKILWFKGVGVYLESLVAQIRAPLLRQLEIIFFNQIAFALPHLSYLLSITEVFKPLGVAVGFDRNRVTIDMFHHGSNSESYEQGPFLFHVTCNQLDWQIDCAAQICPAIIPALSGVKRLTLHTNRYPDIPTELQNGVIDSATWHDLLRLFTWVKELYISNVLLEELSRALQVDEVGSDLGFLPNLQSIHTKHNRFTSFIDARRVVGRPVQWYQW